MIRPDELLGLCDDAVACARRLGADQVEVCGGSVLSAEVELQKDDLHTAASEDETSFGVRVFRGGSLGFATVNGRAHLEAACRDALAMAAAAPADPRNGLGPPRPVAPLEQRPDASIGELGVEELVELAMGMLGRVKALDARVRIDSGGVRAVQMSRAIATSTGIRLAESRAQAGANLFGMAVDGDDVGSMDYDSVSVLRGERLAADIELMSARFAERCSGALGARRGESFRGTALLSPEVVRSFVLGNLLPVLSAQAVRTGRSPLRGRIGEAIAAAPLTLVDDGRLAEGTASTAFDREGMPTRRTVLVESGVLRSFLYDLYESRVASVEPTGSARGGATDLPRIGACNLLVEAGDTPFAELCREPERAVLVRRFSGSSSPVTGEFSGVVKGGFLLHRGERVPVRETLIAGNLYDLLRSISGVSKEVHCLQGSAFVPALRVEGISVTTG